jgi:hypothetical protein
MKTLHELMEDHNSRVKPEYVCADNEGFENYVYRDANFVDQYIEISSNETLSGHAETLDLEGYIHLFGFGES